MAISCCRYCVAPKRHPGCHDHCCEYIAEKAVHDKEKAEADKKKRIEYGLDSQYERGVQRAIRIYHKKG